MLDENQVSIDIWEKHIDRSTIMKKCIKCLVKFNIDKIIYCFNERTNTGCKKYFCHKCINSHQLCNYWNIDKNKENNDFMSCYIPTDILMKTYDFKLIINSTQYRKIIPKNHHDIIISWLGQSNLDVGLCCLTLLQDLINVGEKWGIKFVWRDSDIKIALQSFPIVVFPSTTEPRQLTCTSWNNYDNDNENAFIKGRIKISKHTTFTQFLKILYNCKQQFTKASITYLTLNYILKDTVDDEKLKYLSKKIYDKDQVIIKNYGILLKSLYSLFQIN